MVDLIFGLLLPLVPLVVAQLNREMINLWSKEPLEVAQGNEKREREKYTMNILGKVGQLAGATTTKKEYAKLQLETKSNVDKEVSAEFWRDQWMQKNEEQDQSLEQAASCLLQISYCRETLANNLPRPITSLSTFRILLCRR